MIQLLFRVTRLSVGPDTDDVVIECSRYVEEAEQVDVYTERMNKVFKDITDNDIPPKFVKILKEMVMNPILTMAPPRGIRGPPDFLVTLSEKDLGEIRLGSVIKVNVEETKVEDVPERKRGHGVR